VWWEQNKATLARHNNLSVFNIDAQGADLLVDRTMQLQCSIDDGAVYLSDDNHNLSVSVTELV